MPARIQNDEISEDQLDAARDAVGRFVSRFTKAELMQVGYERGILMAPAMTIADLVNSEQLRSRDFFATVQEGGQPRTLPVRFAGGCEQAFVRAGPAPDVGQHNADVYGALAGLTSAEVAALVAQGTV
jgi:crotonobetainyl-CoA:carnitine CoA-transferase CaiB-like acyl-CoA transferase